MKRIYCTFDLFGTLVDVRTACSAFFEQKLGCTRRQGETYYELWNDSIFNQISTERIAFSVAAGEHLREIANNLDREEFVKAYAGAMPFADTESILKQLKEKAFIVAITNSDNNMIPFVKIRHLFDKIITAEDAGYFYKPDREIFTFALKTLKCNKEDIIHIASSVRADVKGAVPLGWKMVYLNRYGITPHPKPWRSIERLEELLEIMSKNLKSNV